MSVKIKLLSLSAVLILSALFFGYTLYLFNQALDLNSAIWLLISIILFLSLFILQTIIIKNFYALAGLCLAETLVMLIPFYRHMSLLLLAASISTFFILLWTVWNNRQYMKNLLKISFSTTVARIAAKASIALIIFGVLVYISFITFQDIVDSLLQSTQSIVQTVVTQFIPAAPLDVSAQVQDLFLTQLSELPENIKKLTVAGFAILIFFSAKTFFILINWVAVLVSFIIYKILLAARFITITTETKEKEIIAL